MRIHARACLGAIFTLALVCGSSAFAQDAPGVEKDDFAAGSAKDVPHYKVDPFWPKQLPNNWILGAVGGLAVDSKDHIWIANRPRTSSVDELGSAQRPTRADCCNVTPSIIEFDAAGNVLTSWGGPGYVPDWPEDEHNMWVDKSGFVWITDANNRQVLKFTQDGKQVLEIGHKSKAPKNNQDTSILGYPAGLFVDDAAHEVYIGDGYLNNRVVVYDSDTGAFKRGWGAYGIPLSEVTNDIEVGGRGGSRSVGTIGTGAGRGAEPVPPDSKVPPYSFPNGIKPLYKAGDPPDKQFRSPVHCVDISVDRLLYVCDRHNNRIQVFTPEGKFVKEFFLRMATLGNGSTWTLVFSHDKAQKYLIVCDGENDKMWVMRRSDGAVVSSFGSKGRSAGQFIEVHSLAEDSKGNLYTGEVSGGERVQKFVLSK